MNRYEPQIAAGIAMEIDGDPLTPKVVSSPPKTATADAPAPKPPFPRGSVLRYRVQDHGGLDPLHLQEIAEQIHSLVCSGLPGSRIKKISYDGFDLTIEVG